MKLLLSTIALSLLVATPALAAKKAPKKKNYYPWFVQLSVGQVVSSNAEERAVEHLTAAGHEIATVDFKQDSTGYIFELGYEFNENWAVTAGYLDFGDTTFDVTSLTGHGVELIDEIAQSAPRYGDGNTFSLVYSLDLTSAVSASVDAGILYLESTSEVELEFVTYEITDHSMQYFMSAGLDYKFNDYRVGLHARHYEIDKVGTNWVGVRLGYHF
ncbi:outer membrane beta-barrel protein [Paraglaciecola sp. L3A3]|uniref:outer membrane beta-barrel protein n=1 Tax=Paraglaciecola sp. L3A3 TaxID=2686358 RepID=UPI00131DE134|nr:outer membrane beta-barrel protein [Paraglaciecola sp. L3A3]